MCVDLKDARAGRILPVNLAGKVRGWWASLAVSTAHPQTKYEEVNMTTTLFKPAALATVAVMLGIGSSAAVLGSAAAQPTDHAGAHAAKHHHKKHHKRGIPQHNGGDHDSDNNGGPTDGDGNV